MRVPRWLFWFIVYGIAVACWVVFFEYGPGRERFLFGAERETTKVFEKVRRWIGAGGPS